MAQPKVMIHITNELQPEAQFSAVAQEVGLEYLAFSGPHAGRVIRHTYQEGRLACLLVDLELTPPPHIGTGRDWHMGAAFIQRMRGADTVPAELFEAVVGELLEALQSPATHRDHDRQRWEEFREMLVSRPEGQPPGPPRYNVPIIAYSDHAQDDDVCDFLQRIDDVYLVQKGPGGPAEVGRLLSGLLA